MCVWGTDLKINHSSHVRSNEGTSLRVAVQLINVFLIVFGQQWRSTAQRNKLHLGLATQSKLVCRLHSLLLWSF